MCGTLSDFLSEVAIEPLHTDSQFRFFLFNNSQQYRYLSVSFYQLHKTLAQYTSEAEIAP